MKKLVLVQKGDVCFFSNPKTESENETFSDKLSGVKIILDCVKENFITKCNELELIEALIKLRNFPIGPVNKKDQLNSDKESLDSLGKVRELLRRFSLSETRSDLPKFLVCEGCKHHASFISNDFVTGDFDNQKEADECLEELFEKGKVNRVDRDKLQIEILTSGLPRISKDESAIMN